MDHIPAGRSITGNESLRLDVQWVDSHRDRIRILHTPVGGPGKQLVVDGRSMDDVMKTIAQFFDYELDLTQENAFVLRFK